MKFDKKKFRKAENFKIPKYPVFFLKNTHPPVLSTLNLEFVSRPPFSSGRACRLPLPPLPPLPPLRRLGKMLIMKFSLAVTVLTITGAFVHGMHRALRWRAGSGESLAS